MRVLAAEDNVIARLDLCEILVAAGHEVCAEARDGVEAIDLARLTHPDIAFLDVGLPLLDGLEAARKILEEQHIPIVIVTGSRNAGLVADAMTAGVACSYLAKPFAVHDVHAAVAAATRASRQKSSPTTALGSRASAALTAVARLRPRGRNESSATE